jgi:protein transport protein SEC13
LEVNSGLDIYFRCETDNSWVLEHVLDGHSDWVRDVAFAPNIGLPTSYLASCSQDKTVLIWSWDEKSSQWSKTPLKNEKFGEVLWRVSWSISGNILAVSGGDNKVTLWKQNLDGNWEVTEDLNLDDNSNGR